MDDDNKIDVSLLSYKFMEYLEQTPSDILKDNIKLNIPVKQRTSINHLKAIVGARIPMNEIL